MRDFAVPFLLAFIAGVAVAAVAGWFLRDRIRERMARRRRGGS
jgi:predicted PurR-regulated permease PerM